MCPQVDKHGKVQLTNTLGLKGSGKALYPRKEDVFLHSKQRSRGHTSNRIPPYSAVLHRTLPYHWDQDRPLDHPLDRKCDQKL